MPKEFVVLFRMTCGVVESVRVLAYSAIEAIEVAAFRCVQRNEEHPQQVVDAFESTVKVA